MTLEMMKARQQELHYSDKKLAELTDTHPSTFSRRWNGDGQNLPHDFVAKCCLVLGLSVDEDERSPTNTSRMNVPVTEEAHEEIMRHFADRMNEKNELLEYRAELIAKLQADVEEQHKMFHETNRQNIERIDRMTAEAKEREDRKNKIIMRQSRTIMILGIALAAVTVFLIYFMIDAFNGDWGIVRYIMELLPDPSHGADSGQEIVNGITGLWNNLT